MLHIMVDIIIINVIGDITPIHTAIQTIIHTHGVTLGDIINIMANIFGFICAMSFIVCYIPQIIKIIKTHNVSGISPGMYWFCLIGYISNISYLYIQTGLLAAIWIIVGNVVCLVFCIFTLIIYYKNTNIIG